MGKFGEKEIAKEIFYAVRKPKKNWDVNFDNMVISKSIEIKINSRYLIEIKFDKSIRKLVLIMPKMSRYVKIFKVKEGDNKLMYFRIDNKKLL